MRGKSPPDVNHMYQNHTKVLFEPPVPILKMCPKNTERSREDTCLRKSNRALLRIGKSLEN